MRPGATGMRMSGTRKPEEIEVRVVDAEAIVLALRIPALELHDQLDALRRAGRGDAEQIAEVDQAEAADFHVMARQLRTAADDDRRGAPPDLDRVVGDEPMAAHDEVERAFALADAALPHHQHAEAEDVEEHAVDDLADGEAILEQRRELADRGRRADARASAAARRLVSASIDQVGRRLEAAGDEDARHLGGERAARRASRRAAPRVEALEKRTSLSP